MISVIIPYMPNTNAPNDYGKYLDDCVSSLERQTAKPQIIVSEHGEEKHIRKNYLLNEGLKRAYGDVVWHCDADYIIDDETALEKAENKIKETLYPVFYSRKYRMFKIADGGLMIRRNVLDRHGPLDESLIGISFVTFPILKWCMDNTKFYVDRNFVVRHQSVPSIKKEHKDTKRNLQSLYDEVIKRREYEMFPVQ